MIGFSRPWLVIVVHGTNVENSCVLAAEAVGVKGICSVLSVKVRFDFFFQPYVRMCRDRHCIRSERSTLQPGSLGWKNVVVSYVSGFVWTSWKKTLHIRDQ